MIAEGHWAISFMETEKEVEAEDDGEVSVSCELKAFTYLSWIKKNFVVSYNCL
jgi:hypothetical protein